MKTSKDRYQNDSRFKHLVDIMYDLIVRYKFTPSEMRNAAAFASILHEERTIQRITVPEIPKVVEE